MMYSCEKWYLESVVVYEVQVSEPIVNYTCYNKVGEPVLFIVLRKYTSRSVWGTKYSARVENHHPDPGLRKVEYELIVSHPDTIYPAQNLIELICSSLGIKARGIKEPGVNYQ